MTQPFKYFLAAGPHPPSFLAVSETAELFGFYSLDGSKETVQYCKSLTLYPIVWRSPIAMYSYVQSVVVPNDLIHLIVLRMGPTEKGLEPPMISSSLDPISSHRLTNLRMPLDMTAFFVIVGSTICVIILLFIGSSKRLGLMPSIFPAFNLFLAQAPSVSGKFGAVRWLVVAWLLFTTFIGIVYTTLLHCSTLQHSAAEQRKNKVIKQDDVT